MGGAEGTKLDHDFMDMETVILQKQCVTLATIKTFKICAYHRIENRRNRRISGGITNQNQGIFATKSNSSG